MNEEDFNDRTLKRAQRAAKRQQKQKEQKRLRMAQELQRKLEEVETKQHEVEGRGVDIEKALRGEGPGERTCSFNNTLKVRVLTVVFHRPKDDHVKTLYYEIQLSDCAYSLRHICQILTPPPPPPPPR